MSKKRIEKEKLPSQGPYVKLHKGTIESPAWRELSHGAKCLFIELWSKTDNADHRSYLSYREASRKLSASRHKVREWFAELDHYGFIVMLQKHSLGVDGKGKDSLWRVTDKGTVRGGYEPPTYNFLKWAGDIFDPKPYRVRHGALQWDAKTESRFPRGSQGGSHVGTSGGSHTDPPNRGSGSHGVAIEETEGGSHGVAITSLTTRGDSTGAPLSAPVSHLERSPNNFGPSQTGDDRLLSLTKWGKAAQRKPWTRPTILSDEPRDFAVLPPASELSKEIAA